ncbi:hypothetical protein SASPL_123374 [Salvia splendens]|uniref:Uncharacterized protein n=1 Tax=Salvia splendens TaxID=180675 RepID=A0A8X8XQ43_SALSN|nr:hypothetical protein SASPL_123374 [Salvia splendens]
MLYEKKERKISRKLRTYKAFQEKMEMADLIIMSDRFNGHLKKKGISGQINVSFEDQTLSVEVKCLNEIKLYSHQECSVHDTSGLSGYCCNYLLFDVLTGGERSFSTLCFALALHEMTEAPFRAMDEFDVFMNNANSKYQQNAFPHYFSTKRYCHAVTWKFYVAVYGGRHGKI